MVRIVELASHITEVRDDREEVMTALVEVSGIALRHIPYFNLSEDLLQIIEGVESANGTPTTRSARGRGRQQAAEQRVLEAADALEEKVLKYLPSATAACLLDNLLREK